MVVSDCNDDIGRDIGASDGLLYYWIYRKDPEYVTPEIGTIEGMRRKSFLVVLLNEHKRLMKSECCGNSEVLSYH